MATNTLDQPSDISITVAQLLDLGESATFAGVIAGFLDVFGGGPQLLTPTLTLGLLGGFVTLRVLLWATTLVWMDRYLSGISVTGSDLLTIGVVAVVLIVGPALFYMGAMAPSAVNLTLIAAVIAVLFRTQTEYEFSVNDHPIIEG